MALNAGPNKRMGDAGRLRNTATNRASKGPAIPGVPNNVGTPSLPGFGADYGGAASAGGQLAGAYAQFQTLAAAMRAKRVGLRAQFGTDKASIAAGAMGAMSDVINTGIDRGLTGASSVSQERIGVIADMKSQTKAAKNAMRQGIVDTKVAEQQAYLDYQIAQQQIEAQAAAARQANEIAQAQLAAAEAGASNLMAAIDAYGESGRTEQTATRFMGAMVIPGAVNPTTGETQTYVEGVGYVPSGSSRSQLRQRILDARTRSRTTLGTGGFLQGVQ
jgi:hypothetical protein